MIPSCSAPTLKDSPPSAAHTIPRHRVWLGALALAVAVALAYSNACTVPFLLDDATSIESNASLHSWRTVLFPPSDRSETVGGRPLLNVSLALNYAISGTSVWSYHLVNVLIHVCAALALFGLVRRTLVKCGMNEHGAFWCALAAAGIWALHPLLTEAVTYIVQRAESLMAMWYLLTLYCFARAADAEGKVAQAILPVQGGATANSTGKRRLSRNVNNTCSKTGDLMECGDLSPLWTSRLAGSQQCMHEARRCGVTSPAVKSGDKSPHSITRQVARQSRNVCATLAYQMRRGAAPAVGAGSEACATFCGGGTGRNACATLGYQMRR